MKPAMLCLAGLAEWLTGPLSNLQPKPAGHGGIVQNLSTGWLTLGWLCDWPTDSLAGWLTGHHRSPPALCANMLPPMRHCVSICCEEDPMLNGCSNTTQAKALYILSGFWITCLMPNISPQTVQLKGRFCTCLLAFELRAILQKL